jgi:streptogramin lyase
MFCSKAKLLIRGLVTFFILACALINTYTAEAQSIRLLTTKDGLPQSYISGLVQDNDGFIWLGTRNGLARYDGVHFKVFQHNSPDTTNLASNLIIWINRDIYNNLWIEYESGEIDQFNPKTEQVGHFSKHNLLKENTMKFVRRGWLVTSDRTFWGILNGGGLDRFRPGSRQPDLYSHQTGALPSDTLRGLMEDRHKQVWVLSEKGLSGFNKKTQRFTHYPTPVSQDFNDFFDAEKEIIDLHECKNGEIMWGDRKRLFFFHPLNHSYRIVPLPRIFKLGIRWIRTGPDGYDYFETGGSIYRYNGHVIVSVLEKEENNPIDVRSFLIDKSSLMWIGTNAHGINQFDLNTPFFLSYRNKVGFPQDLLKRELNISANTLFDWKEKDEQRSPAGYHFRSAYDKYHRLWMALKETVCYNDHGKIIKLPRVPVNTDKKDNGIGIKGLTTMPDGNPMVVLYNGKILYFNPADGKWISFIGDQEIRNRFGRAVLPQDIINDGRTIWITTDKNGLLYIDVATKQIHRLKNQIYPGAMPTDQLLGLKQDPKRTDLLWIGSYQGLICLNKKTLKSRLFSTEQGLPDNTIYSMQTDKTGYLWISTNKGLCRFNPISHQIRVFQASYGLQGDEFNRFHHFETQDGRLAFGGPEGWTVFNPLVLKNDNFQPKVAFTALKINNGPIDGLQDKLLPFPINAMRKLVLSYEQNTLNIEFAGLQFNHPHDLSYRYQLVGYDNNWVMAGHSPVANYTKIPPGNYSLKVNASNTTGEWSNHYATIDIIIESPWWLTWWSYIGYALIFAGILSLFIRYRINRELLSKEMKLREKEALLLKNSNARKDLALENIAFIQSHELRKPLASILGLIGVIKAMDYEIDKECIAMLEEAGKELDTKIRSVISHVENEAS